MRSYAGTSGWSYAWWKGTFYPSSVKAGDWLKYYATHLSAVEVNNSFYRLPSPAMVKRWRDIVPKDFSFAVKAWRGITHLKRLRDCSEQLQAFQAVLDLFGSTISSVLYQLPPTLHADIPLLEDFLSQLPKGYDHAIEFRHESWFCAAAYKALEKKKVALCHAHLKDWTTPRQCTAPFAYIRMHGTRGLYRGGYSDDFLKKLAEWLYEQRIQRTHVYFNNTDAGAVAIRDAETLSRLLAEA